LTKAGPKNRFNYICRECSKDFVTYTEQDNEDVAICKECYKELENNVKISRAVDVLYNILDSKNPNNLIEHIDIQNKVECALWCGLNFESEKGDYLYFGHTNESYEGFLVQTYVSTKESMPETIESEHGANKGELEQK